jgi:hypothetical protein
MKNSQPKRIIWFAACDEIARIGPFEDQVEAWRNLEVAPSGWSPPSRKHMPGSYVWPEERED